MLLISTSLVLIVALNLVAGWKRVAQPSRPSATSVISASGVKSLGSGGFLPPGAMPITYRHGGRAPKPYGGTNCVAAHTVFCSPPSRLRAGGRWVTAPYDESRDTRRCSPPAVRAAPGAVAAVRRRWRDRAGECRPAA